MCHLIPDSIVSSQHAAARRVMLQQKKPWGVAGVLIRPLDAPDLAEDVIDSLSTWATEPKVRDSIDALRGP
jgi:hypothetical protein